MYRFPIFSFKDRNEKDTTSVKIIHGKCGIICVAPRDRGPVRKALGSRRARCGLGKFRPHRGKYPQGSAEGYLAGP